MGETVPSSRISVCVPPSNITCAWVKDTSNLFNKKRMRKRHYRCNCHYFERLLHLFQQFRVKVFANERVFLVCLPRDRGRRRLAQRLECFHACGLEFAEDAHIHPAISSAYRVFPVSWSCRGFKRQTGKVASARMEATGSDA